MQCFEIPRFATELVRGNCSSTLRAALANALFYDIKHLLRNDVKIEEILLDKCKLDRAKANVRVVCDEKNKIEKRNLVCIGEDRKVDSNIRTYTTVHASDGSMILKQSFDAEHYLTFTEETGTASGVYLTHKVIPMTGATGELLAEKAFNVLEEHGSVTSIKALLVDNTATNTGLKNGLMSNLEDKLQQNLHLIGCALHQNKLLLRAIFKKLDGSTTSPASFSGHLARQCGKNWNQISQVEFQPISTNVSKELSKEIKCDLSSGQRLLYVYCIEIDSGMVDEKWASWKIGPLCHSRWITLATRLLCLYTRKQNPSQKPTDIVKCIVQIYAPTWLPIKVSSKFADSPKILFTTISQLHSMTSDDIRLVAQKNIQGNAFCLLPENFLYAMIKDNDPAM